MNRFIEALKRTTVITVAVLLLTAVILDVLISILLLLEPFVGSLAAGIIAIVAVTFIIILLAEMT